MPIYQYHCLNCNLQFELKQSFDDKPVADCPRCHGIARRIFSPVPIIFNGPGFYVTDSREEKGRKASPEASGKKHS
ncbi:MAG: FmdB family zinc ribbon protein [Dehalococcoidia bacterium]